MAKILLVDDDPITLKIVSFVLKAGGHSVDTACDGYAALEHCRSERVQLVISDVNLPGGFSGFRLVEAIKEDEGLKHIPVVLLTVRSGKSDVDRATKAGAEHYFIKPVQPEPFRAKIAEILAKHTSAKHLGEAPVREKGLLTSLIQVTGVSESGLRIDCPVPLPEGFEFCFASNVFHKIGITTPQLRVASCEPGANGESFDMKLEFVELAAGELQSVRKWLNENRAAKKPA